MDNTNNVQTPEPKENNKKIIIIASIAIVVLIAAFVILGLSLNWFGGKKSNDKSASATAPTISVVETKGAEAKTTKAKIKLRDVKFGDSIKKVKKYEKKQEDTLDNPSEASTKDGYTYLTYLFDDKKAEFYGVKVTPSNSGSLLQYVFKNKKLFDIRVQYGDIGSKDRTKIKKAMEGQYGKPTYSIKYSNKSTKDNWRTAAKNPDKQTILSLNYSPGTNVIVEYESVSR